MEIMGKLYSLTKISAFLNKKFLEWEQETGERKTISEFGIKLGISQAQMSLYMGGKRQPTSAHRKLIIEQFGDEAILAFDEDPDLYHIQEKWDYLEPATRRRLRAEAEKESKKRKTPA